MGWLKELSKKFTPVPPPTINEKIAAFVQKSLPRGCLILDSEDTDTIVLACHSNAVSFDYMVDDNDSSFDDNARAIITEQIIIPGLWLLDESLEEKREAIKLQLKKLQVDVKS